MNENSIKKGYLKEQLAPTDTVLTTKLARVGITLLAILVGLLLVACPSDDSSNGGDGNGNGGPQGRTEPIAIWALAPVNGGFVDASTTANSIAIDPFAICQRDLDAGNASTGTALQQAIYNAGYRTARFFGSTPANPTTGTLPAGTGYDYTALATGDPDGLALSDSEATTVNVSLYAGDGSTPTTTFGAPPIAVTIGELIGGTNATTGAFSTSGSAVITAVGSTAYWTFTTKAGAYFGEITADASANPPIVGRARVDCLAAAATSANNGTQGSATLISGDAAGVTCDMATPVICVAK